MSKFQLASMTLSLGVVFAIAPFQMAVTIVVVQLIAGGLLGFVFALFNWEPKI